MVVNYIIREVSPHAAKVSSYRLGKSYTGEHFDDMEDAASFAIRCNECCVLPGIRYFVFSCEEATGLPPDVFIEASGARGV